MATDSLPERLHPAPARPNSSILSLALDMALSPLAWSTQSILGYCLSSRACYPRSVPLLLPSYAWIHSLLLAVTGVAMLVCMVSFLTARRQWRSAWHEVGGDSARLLDVGEGRTRFLAMWGMLIAASFFIATGFSLLTIMLAPLCR